jgi:hypothetical protein
MRSKHLGLALVAISAIAAFIASSAMATATESNGYWYKDASQLTTSESLICGNSGNFTLESTVLGTPLKLQATGVSCPSSSIFNESSKAKASGKLKFSGVTVVEPSGCVVAGGTVESAELRGQIWMEGATAYERFAPASGTTFAKISIEKCVIAETFLLKGTVFGKSVNATNVAKATQELEFSGAINSTAGGSLTIGVNSATLKGTSTFKLTSGDEILASEYGTTLCKVQPEEVSGRLVCPKGEAFSGEIEGTLEAGTEATFESTEGPSGTISCNESSFVGNFKEDGNSATSGGITAQVFKSSGGSCTSTLAGKPSVGFTSENLPYDETAIAYQQPAAPQAFTIFKKSNGEIRYRFSLTGPLGNVERCSYQIVGQLPGKLTQSATKTSMSLKYIMGLIEEKPVLNLCPKILEVGSKYLLTQKVNGLPVYAASK